MANPQVENGYIRISSELWDAITALRIPGEARQCLDFIIRKTYGYQKKEDLISISQFALATKQKKPNVIRSINKLISLNLIIKKDNGAIPSYCFNKNYDKWKPLSKRIIVIKKDNLPLSKKIPTKDIITKDNIYSSFSHFEQIWILYPNRVGKKLAYRHYKASVKTEEDFNNIKKALENYKNLDKVKSGYIQNGSTWFNNWQDYIDYQEPTKNDDDVYTVEDARKDMY